MSLSLENVPSHAPHIQNRFFGCLLSVSRLNDFVYAITSRSNASGPLSDELYQFSPVEFGSYVWDVIVYYKDEIFNRVFFSQGPYYSDLEKMKVRNVFNKLFLVLCQKYSEYIKEHKDDVVFFHDGYTTVSLQLTEMNDDSLLLTLAYCSDQAYPYSEMDDF